MRISVIVFRLLYILLCVVFINTFTYSQFSPGELSKQHAFLEGNQNCTKCHELASGTSKEKCLSCHEEISIRIQKKRGFHATISMQTCVSCHKEHLGNDFSIVQLDEQSFEHGTTGFFLDGKHETLSCDKCHAKDRIKESDIIHKLQKYPHKTYLGLNIYCGSCHADAHQGSVDPNCTTCHVTKTWTSTKKFNHAQTNFPLLGKHVSVQCASCHAELAKQKRDKISLKFTTKPFDDCSPCHRSPHPSTFTNKECRSCHEPSGWKSAREKPFDHSMTKFALKGKHATLHCEKCHSPRIINYTKRYHPASSMCTDCHIDTHSGEFKLKYNNRCEACHSNSLFVPSLFTVQQHSESRFALTGEHTKVSCRNCHIDPISKKLIFQRNEVRCETCHKDHHDGKYQSLMKEYSCDGCHTTSRWNIKSFDHASAGFPLTGEHSTVPCSKCHISVSDTTLTQKKPDARCNSCHKDIHEGQFVLEGVVDCRRCHSIEGWKPTLFNHETQSNFLLTGVHKQIACSRCHYSDSQSPQSVIRFKPMSLKCESCHTTALMSRLFSEHEENSGKACISCHHSK